MSYRGSKKDEDAVFGEVEMLWKDSGIPSTKFDKLALSGRNQLLLLSVVAETQRVKQMRAVLCASSVKGVSINASGIQVRRPGDEDWRASTPGRIYAGEDGYQVFTHKLGFGLAHALFITRSAGFMPVVTHTALWNELKDTRFTTPVLPEWLPFIEESLRAEELLESAHAFGCQCGLLTATTKQLDKIVTEGLQQRLITIPSAKAAQPALSFV